MDLTRCSSHQQRPNPPPTPSGRSSRSSPHSSRSHSSNSSPKMHTSTSSQLTTASQHLQRPAGCTCQRFPPGRKYSPLVQAGNQTRLPPLQANTNTHRNRSRCPTLTPNPEPCAKQTLTLARTSAQHSLRNVQTSSFCQPRRLVQDRL